MIACVLARYITPASPCLRINADPVKKRTNILCRDIEEAFQTAAAWADLRIGVDGIEDLRLPTFRTAPSRRHESKSKPHRCRSVPISPRTIPMPPPRPLTTRQHKPRHRERTRHVEGSFARALRSGAQYGTFVSLSPRCSFRQPSQRALGAEGFKSRHGARPPASAQRGSNTAGTWPCLPPRWHCERHAGGFPRPPWWRERWKAALDSPGALLRATRRPAIERRARNSGMKIAAETYGAATAKEGAFHGSDWRTVARNPGGGSTAPSWPRPRVEQLAARS